jgi:hypothetical protein
MIATDDILILPYTPDLTEAGLAFAGQLLPSLQLRTAPGARDIVRRAVTAAAVKLAFRRFLTNQGIAFGVRHSVPFGGHERYETEVGGRLCELKCFLISEPSQIDRLSSNPGAALDAPALVPSDHMAADGLRGDDLYLFALVTAAPAVVPTESARVDISNRRTFWFHTMPATWRRPRTWAPLGPLAVKADASPACTLELTGQNVSGEVHRFAVELLPRQRIEVREPFYALSHVQTQSLPSGRIGLHAPTLDNTCLIGKEDWQDGWLEGRCIYLLGWITRAQFRMRAHPVPAGSRVFQFWRTKTKNLAVEASSLKPISELLARAREGWMVHGTRKTS